MAGFKVTKLVSSPFADIQSWALGKGPDENWTMNEIGKAVKLSADSTMALCEEGDSISGYLVAKEVQTVNDGYNFGSVLRNSRWEAVNTGTETLAIEDTVVAAAQAAIGTRNEPGEKEQYMRANVKKGAGRWQVIAFIQGAGATGSRVLIEKV